MSIEKYRGYIIEGFAKPAGTGEFASLGRMTKGRYVIMESELIGLYERNEEAQGHAILWAQDYVDRLENPH